MIFFSDVSITEIMGQCSSRLILPTVPDEMGPVQSLEELFLYLCRRWRPQELPLLTYLSLCLQVYSIKTLGQTWWREVSSWWCAPNHSTNLSIFLGKVQTHQLFHRVLCWEGTQSSKTELQFSAYGKQSKEMLNTSCTDALDMHV